MNFANHLVGNLVLGKQYKICFGATPFKDRIVTFDKSAIDAQERVFIGKDGYCLELGHVDDSLSDFNFSYINNIEEDVAVFNKKKLIKGESLINLDLAKTIESSLEKALEKMPKNSDVKNITINVHQKEELKEKEDSKDKKNTDDTFGLKAYLVEKRKSSMLNTAYTKFANSIKEKK